MHKNLNQYTKSCIDNICANNLKIEQLEEYKKTTGNMQIALVKGRKYFSKKNYLYHNKYFVGDNFINFVQINTGNMI